MTIDPRAERIGLLLAVPHELLEYQRWLDEQRRAAPAERDYLFARAEPRFEPRRDDVLVVQPGLELAQRSGTLLLRAPEPRLDLQLPALARSDAERILAAIDGTRCLLEVLWHSGVDRPALAKLLRAAFGRVLFAPRAVAALEARLSCTEVVRFPASPYAVERPYWENMIAVRERFAEQRTALGDTKRFVGLLRELHVIVLMGPTLQSFYKPQSPVADHTVAPGTLYHDAARLLRTPTGVAFLDGPRVSAALLGGEAYWNRLARELGDPAALEPERALSLDGLDWGTVVCARSERDEQLAAWFCPPRPMTDQHLDVVRDALSAASTAAAAGDREQAMRSLARFHYAFVRLHPFHCANQSLAMNLVNAVLGPVLGSGIPHLVLDHLALRFTLESYQEAFRRAVDAYAIVTSAPAERLSALAMLGQRCFGLFARMTACTSVAQVDELCRAEPEAARAALLRA
jgi:hypothetical protein